MNILPKKSWHVRTRKNIDKVRRDEAKAAEEERSIQARSALAEQEARTDLLRNRAHGKTGQAATRSDFAVEELFADLNQGKADKRHNTEREREAKLEQEKWEKKIGLLQSLTDGSEEKPWYLDSHSVRMKLEDTEIKKKSVTSSVKDKVVKNYQYDPLNTMQMYLDQMKSTRSKSTQSSSKEKSAEAERKHRNQKKHEERKQRYESTSHSNSQPSSTKTDKDGPVSKIEQLRAERLKREKLERERASELVKSKRQKCDKLEDERFRSYQNQFNPHLAKH